MLLVHSEFAESEIFLLLFLFFLSGRETSFPPQPIINKFFFHSVALDECGSTEEGVINNINLLAPDIIVSVLPSPKQEYFLLQNKVKLSARLWYGVGSGKITGHKHSLKYMLLKKLRKHKLMKYVNKE